MIFFGAGDDADFAMNLIGDIDEAPRADVDSRLAYVSPPVITPMSISYSARPWARRSLSPLGLPGRRFHGCPDARSFHFDAR